MLSGRTMEAQMPDEPAEKTAEEQPSGGLKLVVEPIEEERAKVIIEEVDESQPEVVPRPRLAFRRPELKIKATVMSRSGRKQGPPTNPSDAFARLNKKS
jgi:hypothetical protein